MGLLLAWEPRSRDEVESGGQETVPNCPLTAGHTAEEQTTEQSP